MFERYTLKARRVIFFARFEASQLGRGDAVNAEHLLLGLLRESTPTLAELFKSPLEHVRRDVESSFAERPGASVPTSVDLPLTEDAERVLEGAAQEAKRLEKNYIGLEHLLLGILRGEQTQAATILGKDGLKIEELRAQIELSPPRHFDDSIGSG